MLLSRLSLLLSASILLTFVVAAEALAESTALPVPLAYAAFLQFQPVFFLVLLAHAVFPTHRPHPDQHC